ncbi:MAG: 3-keto-5-aminohexanoate cleavage protein [Deltaproteobacteria bacterium]|nr:3-keto-5-aminohexanoate cleavage protein [Deltaproteobacteria bacterium]
MEKLIITVAPTGSVPTKKMTPHVPITPDEIIRTAVACEAAGASVIHIHARNLADQSPSADFALFEEIYTGVKEKTSLIIQISTGGRAGMAYEARNERLMLKPEMASLTTGSVNFPNSVYENSPQLIEALARDMQQLKIKPEMEIFDTGMISNALSLVAKGLVETPLHFDFVLGLKGALPATIANLVHLKNTIPPDATWTVAGIGPAQLPMNTHAILMGGHVRVGLEDNIYFSRGELATNECMVERVADLARIFGRDVAHPDEARKIMHL